MDPCSSPYITRYYGTCPALFLNPKPSILYNPIVVVSMSFPFLHSQLTRGQCRAELKVLESFREHVAIGEEDGGGQNGVEPERLPTDPA